MIELVYETGKDIIMFLVITLIFSMLFGDKAAEYMVLIVLLGMIVLNSKEFVTFLKDF